MHRKKKLTSVVAVILAVVLSVAGTFAWQSINQLALNEASGTNPGGRLHDDFSGSGGTKDIYVENFGSEPIYARLRLDEYMEIGAGAGTKDGITGNSTAVSLVTGADIDDVSTWTTHIPGADAANTGVGAESPTWADTDRTFHDYWEWTMGGQDTENNPDGKTIYMPTFNKNQDSLKADINGTLEGTTPGDSVRYDDYHAYTDGEIKTADAYYDADDNTLDECGPNGGPDGTGIEGTNYTAVEQKHTAQSTESGKVITMAEWLALPAVDPGDESEWRGNVQAWVYDTDGWAYWSQPIVPKTATGLLLDKIALTGKAINDRWYYAINVVGQFVTADDLGRDNNTGFYTDGDSAPSDNALTLLESIGVNTKDTASVTVSIMDGTIPVTALIMAPSDTKTLTVRAPGGVDTNWTWTVATDNASGHITVNEGTVTVSADAADGESAVITATNEDETPLTASVTITVRPLTYTAKIQKGGTDTTAEDVLAGDTSGITLTASVTANNGSSVTPDWTWSLDETNAAQVSLSATSGVSTTVTVDSGATDGSTTTVTATDSTTGTTAAVTITAKTKVTPKVNVGGVVTLDGIDFVVMATNVNDNPDHVLLLSRYVLETMGFDNQNHDSGGSDQYGDNVWRDSQIREYLNSTADSVTVSAGENGATTTKVGWLKNKPQIQAAAVDFTIYTRMEYTSDKNTVFSTVDKVFLLSSSDFSADTGKELTVGKKLKIADYSILNGTWRGKAKPTMEGEGNYIEYWLRSPSGTSKGNIWSALAIGQSTATGATELSHDAKPRAGYMTNIGVRPAMVVDINKLPSA